MQKHIVYFLGAGCSYNFGYPLTGAIMPEILTGLKAGTLFQAEDKKTAKEKRDEKILLGFIYKLYPGLQKINIQRQKKTIPNITEVLSIVDHCWFYNNPPHPQVSDEKLQRFRQLLNRAVGEVLIDYENLFYTKKERLLLDKFIYPIKKEEKINRVTVITTNYDLTIDGEFEKHMSKERVDYGIAYRDVDSSQIIQQPVNPLFRYYKLHGSLNWTRCDLCGHYYINTEGSIVHLAFKEKLNNANTCICSKNLRLKSVLVAPSLVRDVRDSNLLQIWKASMEAIRTADKLIFVGYSLPAEDLAIKSIIMRGLNGRNALQKLEVEVVQLGNTAKVNYQNLFGKKIKYYSKGLEQYLGIFPKRRKKITSVTKRK